MTDAKVCALISWYDESPIWLAACVASLAGVVDHIVAVDGAYMLYPDASARPSSPVQQHLAIVEAAAAARIPLTLHVPGRPWFGNEVEKRNATVQLALAGAADGPSWWLMVVDADMRVVSHPGGLRHRLSRTTCDVASFGMRERIDVEQNTRLARAARLGTLPKETLLRFPCIFRADPTLEYVGTHYVVRNASGYLFNGPGAVLPCEDCSMEVEFEHFTQLRDRERSELQRTYYRRRDEAAIERVPAAVASW